jgi:hypothetical protein
MYLPLSLYLPTHPSERPRLALEGFMWNFIWKSLLNPVDQIQFKFESDINVGHCIRRATQFLIYVTFKEMSKINRIGGTEIVWRHADSFCTLVALKLPVQYCAAWRYKFLRRCSLGCVSYFIVSVVWSYVSYFIVSVVWSYVIYFIVSVVWSYVSYFIVSVAWR